MTLHIRPFLKVSMAALALSLGVSHALADSVFSSPDANFRGRLQAGGVVVPGSEITLKGASFKPGQTVTLARGKTILNPEGTPFKADDKGEFEFKLSIPQDAAPGQHPIIVNVANPDAAIIFPLKVSPVIAISGTDKFEAKNEKLVRGLYQVARSDKNNTLFVTSAVGRPPVKESKLLKLNGDTLVIEAEVDTKLVQGREDGHRHAVYGVAVDDAEGNVWTTTTRDGSVAVYKQSDLSLVKQFEPELVPHSRDVVVDAEAGRAYVSAVGGNFISVFDTKELKALEPIEIKSGVRGETFTPTSLSFDKANHKLYSVGMKTGEVAVIDTKNNAVEKVFALPGAKSSIGISVDPTTNQVYVVSQGSDNLIIADVATGKVLHDVATGAGPLNVAFDPVKKLAYVANRGAGTVTVINPQGEIVANLEAGSFPNHLLADGKGNVFVINKARGENDATGDRVTRLTPKS